MSEERPLPAEDWLVERDVETRYGLEAVQFLRCPHCKSRDVVESKVTKLIKDVCYICEECGAESQALPREMQ